MSILLLMREKLFIITSLFFFIAGIIVILVSLLFHLNKLHIGLAFALPPLVYMVLRKEILNDLKNPYVLSRTAFLSSAIVFILITSLGLYYWYVQIYQRSVIFFILIAVAYLIIINQIFFANNRSYAYPILLEIFTLAIIIRGSVYFNFPTVYGHDPFFHINGLEKTVSSGFVSPQLELYTNFPYMTLLAAAIREVLGVDLKIAFFGISLIQVLSSLFVFLIGKIVVNEKIGLLSAAIITMSPYDIYWGFWITPMTLGLSFFVAILYLMIKRTFNCRRRNTALLIFFLLSLVLVHTVSSFVTWISLLVVFFNLILYKTFFSPSKSTKVVTLGLIILFGSAIFSYWSVCIHKGADLFYLFTGSLRISLSGTEVTSVTLAPLYDYLSILLYDLPFTILLFLGIFGLLSLLHRGISDLKFTLGLSTVFLIFLVYGAGFLGIEALLPGRWFPVIEVLLALFVAYGVYLLVSAVKTFKLKLLVSCPLLFVLIFSATTSPLTNGDSAFYAKELGGRSALIESEVIAATFVSTHFKGPVSRNAKYHLIEGWYLLNPNDFTTYSDKMVLLRDYDIEKGFSIPLFGAGGKFSETIYADQHFYDSISHYNIIYENGEVRGYLPPKG